MNQIAGGLVLFGHTHYTFILTNLVISTNNDLLTPPLVATCCICPLHYRGTCLHWLPSFSPATCWCCMTYSPPLTTTYHGRGPPLLPFTTRLPSFLAFVKYLTTPPHYLPFMLYTRHLDNFCLQVWVRLPHIPYLTVYYTLPQRLVLQRYHLLPTAFAFTVPLSAVVVPFFANLTSSVIHRTACSSIVCDLRVDPHRFPLLCYIAGGRSLCDVLLLPRLPLTPLPTGDTVRLPGAIAAHVSPIPTYVLRMLTVCIVYSPCCMP